MPKNWAWPRPWPRRQWPRPRPQDTATCLVSSGLVVSFIAMYLFHVVATATVKSVVMKTKDGNVVNKARSGQGREKNGKPCPAYRCYHLALVTVYVMRIYC